MLKTLSFNTIQYLTTTDLPGVITSDGWYFVAADTELETADRSNVTYVSDSQRSAFLVLDDDIPAFLQDDNSGEINNEPGATNRSIVRYLITNEFEGEATTQEPDIVTDFTLGEDKLQLHVTNVNDGTRTLQSLQTELGLTISARDAGNNSVTIFKGSIQLTQIATLSRELTLDDFNLVVSPGTNNADTLQGGAGADHIDGGAGDDTLSGHGGNDVIIGGAGQDTLTGGAGDDIFVLENDGVSQYDIVKDFASGDKIRIDVAQSGDTLANYLTELNIEIVNSTNLIGTSTNDTVIRHLGADNTSGTSDDRILMVLEDYTSTLDLAAFDVV